MVTILLKVLGTIATKMFTAFATQHLLEWMLFRAAEALVKSTKTKHDDEWLEQFKKSYTKLG